MTVLFADLVGSTTIGERLDAEAIAHAALVRSASPAMTVGAALRIDGDAAAAARRVHATDAEADARSKATAHAADAERLVAEDWAWMWGWGDSMALIAPELARATGNPAAAAWRSAVDTLAATGVVELQAYAMWRLAEALAQAGAPEPEVEAAIRAGVDIDTGAHEPVRRELVQLAVRLGIELVPAAAST